MKANLLLRSIVMAAIAAASSGMGSAPVLSVEKTPFGTVDGKPVELYTLKSTNGIEMKVTTYGGIVTSVHLTSPGPKPDAIYMLALTAPDGSNIRVSAKQSSLGRTWARVG